MGCISCKKSYKNIKISFKESVKLTKLKYFEKQNTVNEETKQNIVNEETKQEDILNHIPEPVLDNPPEELNEGEANTDSEQSIVTLSDEENNTRVSEFDKDYEIIDSS